jgi:N-acetylglucosaminyl-diphospho-decaprenol L-rhamnosyltransferase
VSLASDRSLVVQLPKTMRTLVVVVNFRTPRLTINCLRSLDPELAAYPGSRVIVVDNASGDGSFEDIQAAIAAQGWGAWAEVIASPVNGGFAAGNNMAIRVARERGELPQLVWLVNPDAEVRPGALLALGAFMQAHPKAGIAGGSLENEQGQPWPYAFRFPSVWSEIDNGLRLGVISRWLARRSVVRPMGSEPQCVDWISGANFMIRSEVIDRVGLMDDQYFLYFEETDYCRRAQRFGWECWYVPHARVMHIAGQSTGISSPTEGRPRRRPAYWFESRRRYFVKNHGRLYAWLTDLAWLSCFAFWRLRRRIQKKPDRDPPGMLADFARHSLLRNPFAVVPEQSVRGAQ